MTDRPFWLAAIRSLWRERPIVWLSGVRRVGKTSLCHQVGDGHYFNCDLPTVQRQIADPETFFGEHAGNKPLLLDEVHRLSDPALVLKIAADAFPGIRILATGSSTLHATGKFRDSLTDRKRALHLPPVLWSECRGEFAVPQLDRRLLHGGLPGSLLGSQPDPGFFEEWIDSFYARDIAELFRFRNRTGFISLLKLLLRRNGGLLDITDLSRQTGMSRPTVMSHLDAMEIAHAIIRIPPYHAGSQREIVGSNRAYAFDTGLVAHERGWDSIRDEDRGLLWENLVLDELRCRHPPGNIHFWRDKSGREVDFVICKPRGQADAIEAKVSPDAFDPASLRAFRGLHPDGDNFLICPHVRTPYTIRKGGLSVRVCTL